MDPNQKCKTRDDVKLDSRIGFYPNNKKRVGGSASNSNQSSVNGGSLWERFKSFLVQAVLAVLECSLSLD